MTTGDEEAESLVDNLFRDVDDQFKDLEREYSQAREDLATADIDRQGTPTDPLEASNERFGLLSQVASLQAEVSRQADELDERDRLLGELGDKIAGFEADIERRDEMLDDLHAAKQEALDERREQARLSSLLDARAAERQELADVANRLQNDRDHVQELLTTALLRFDEVEALSIQMDDKVRHLEAARDTAAQEHDARAHELIESRAEMSKLADRLDEFNRKTAEAEEAAEKSEALAERRTNEAGYLNRRIDALNDKLAEAKGFEDEAGMMRRELAMTERRVSELERELGTQQAEASAAQAAVDAIAERTSDYDELVAQVEQLTEERDAAWEAASGYPAAEPAPPAAPPPAPAPAVAPADAAEVISLADRARELGSRRANEAEAAAVEAEARAVDLAAAEAELAAIEADVVDEVVAQAQSELPAPPPPPAPDADAELTELEDADVETIDADLADLVPEPALADVFEAEPEQAAEPEHEIPVFEFDGTVAEVPHDVAVEDEIIDAVSVENPEAEVPHDVMLEDEIIDAVRIDNPVAEAAVAEAVIVEDRPIEDIVIENAAMENAAAVPAEPAILQDNTAEESAAEDSAVEDSAVEDGAAHVDQFDIDSIPMVTLDHLTEMPDSEAEQAEAQEEAAPFIPAAAASRKRMILPADLIPNTPEAVAFLLNQPGVTAIVDARSTCGRTGIRPSELFERVALLRDHFDVPVEIVVTPVSTPVGGAPDLPAIGVHHVTGADTVADRVRALCMGFPADQALVVIAGDDHVRRAAIGQEANVVEPAAVLNVASE